MYILKFLFVAGYIYTYICVCVYVCVDNAPWEEFTENFKLQAVLRVYTLSRKIQQANSKNVWFLWCIEYNIPVYIDCIFVVWVCRVSRIAYEGGGDGHGLSAFHWFPSPLDFTAAQVIIPGNYISYTFTRSCTFPRNSRLCEENATRRLALELENLLKRERRH